ncbi:TPA: hypothetical protein ACKRWH_003278 [Providencia rettgeri]|uniref:hypothetical protein n=1 Tax=Providencia rettgeri TaxID=587 RepID=UPI001B38B2D8|nr:hypothetical protein [Providencia rettgeri]MBQ0399348.1 hypothetical protein [Providencia rettgeri]
MTQSHLDTVNIPEMKAPLQEEVAKKNRIKTQIEEVTADQKIIAERNYDSFLNLIGYLTAGVALWILMQWQFMFVFSNKADVPDELLRFKDLWNVVMYVVPYCFWGMATKHASIMLITTLNICCSAFDLYRLKKKLAK